MAVAPEQADRPEPMGRTALAASLEKAHGKARERAQEAREEAQPPAPGQTGADDGPDAAVGANAGGGADAGGAADAAAETHGGGAAPAGAPADAVTVAMQLLSPEGRIDPYPLYATAHRIGPVAEIGGGWFVVAGYDAVNQVLRSTGYGVSGAQISQERRDEHAALALLAPSILESDPPRHTRMRSLIGSVFTPRRIAALEPMITAAVDELLDGLAESGAGGAPVDFMAEFAFRLPVTVICEMLGVPVTDRQRFRRLAAGLTTALEFMTDHSQLAPADAAAAELAEFFSELIAERRTDTGDDQSDLVGALTAARDADDGRLSEAELLANLTLLLVAGFETTTDLLGNGLQLLFDHPGAARRLRSGEGEVAAFVEEVLRCESPVQVTSRVALAEGLELAGVPIPAGSRLILLIGAANRDPARYPDPDRFDPARPAGKPLSFGVGAHVCLGNGLSPAARPFPRPRTVRRGPDPPRPRRAARLRDAAGARRAGAGGCRGRGTSGRSRPAGLTGRRVGEQRDHLDVPPEGVRPAVGEHQRQRAARGRARGPDVHEVHPVAALAEHGPEVRQPREGRLLRRPVEAVRPVAGQLSQIPQVGAERPPGVGRGVRPACRPQPAA
jgi:cytochrome P450